MQGTHFSYKIIIKLESSRHIYEKYSNIKFHENASDGCLVAPSGQTDRQRDMMKPTVAFLKFANAPQNGLWQQNVPTPYSYHHPKAIPKKERNGGRNG